MMYVFICTDCGQVRMVSGSRQTRCPKCRTMMAACEKSFVEWTELSGDARDAYITEYCNRAKTEELVRFRPMPKYDRIERGY